MAVSGHRHQLLVYAHVLNRWWRLLLWIGMISLFLALALMLLPMTALQGMDRRTLLLLGGAGALSLCSALFLVTIRKYAYVQPCDNHLRLVTPFLKLKISYRRIRQSTSTEFRHIFRPGRDRQLNRSLRELGQFTVIVLDLNGLPLSRAALGLFLSPLFFPDKTARIALLVPDWIRFSTELESFRTAWLEAQRSGTSPASAADIL